MPWQPGGLEAVREDTMGSDRTVLRITSASAFTADFFTVFNAWSTTHWIGLAVLYSLTKTNEQTRLTALNP